MKVYASEIKIRDEFISDITVENSGDEFVLSHSDADFSYDLYQLYRKDRLIVSGLKPSEIFEGITYEGISLDELVRALKNKYQLSKVEYVYKRGSFLHQDGGGDAIPFANKEMDSIRIYIWANNKVQTVCYAYLVPEYFRTDYGLVLHIPIRTANYTDEDIETLDWRNADYEERLLNIEKDIAREFKLYSNGGSYSEKIIPSFYFYTNDVSEVEKNEADLAEYEFKKYIISKNSEVITQSSGWKQDSNGWWYEKDDGTYPHNGWEQIKGYWYLFNADGYMQTGWRQVDGRWYYLKENGIMAVNTWVGNYYVGEDGAMLVNSITPDGYYVGSDGNWIQNSTDYTAFIRVLENSEAEKFALYDLDNDGITELFLETIDSVRQYPQLSVFKLKDGQAIQCLDKVNGGEVAVRKGQPYIAVHQIFTELWRGYLYDGSDSYKLIMESWKGGETLEALPDWGEKDLYVQTVKNGHLLNFVTNDVSNIDWYVKLGKETGYAGVPNLENSYMGWLWGM